MLALALAGELDEIVPDDLPVEVGTMLEEEALLVLSPEQMRAIGKAAALGQRALYVEEGLVENLPEQAMDLNMEDGTPAVSAQRPGGWRLYPFGNDKTGQADGPEYRVRFYRPGEKPQLPSRWRYRVFRVFTAAGTSVDAAQLWARVSDPRLPKPHRKLFPYDYGVDIDVLRAVVADANAATFEELGLRESERAEMMRIRDFPATYATFSPKWEGRVDRERVRD